MINRAGKLRHWILVGAAVFAAVEVALLCGFFYASGQRSMVRERAAGQDSPMHEAIAARDSADWTWWSALAAWIQIPISIAGIAAVIVTIRQTREANSITKEVGQAQTRAYVSLTRSECHMLNDRIEFRYSIKNFGNSPARGVSVNIRAAVVIGSQIVALDPPVHQDLEWEELSGLSLVAGEEVQRTHIPSQDISAAALLYKTAPLWSVDLIVTLSYLDVFKHRTRETQHMLALTGGGLNPTPIVVVPFHTLSFAAEKEPSVKRA